VALADDAECAAAEADLLKKVLEQDVESGDDEGGVRIRRGVAKGRMPSVTDPDMRHGRKSSGTRYDGHKAHVAVEESSGVVTAVDIGAPGEADGAKVSDLIEQTKQTTGCEVEGALGDCAYGTSEARSQAAECGIELRAKMPGPPAGRFGPGAFTLSGDRMQATCPAGHPSEKQSTCRDGVLHVWSPLVCEQCLLKARCTEAAKRQLLARPDFHERRQREEYARSAEGRAVLRRRVVVEHAIGRVKNLGAGTARYFGRAKTRAQWMWTAAAANLSLVWNQPEGDAV
jgi:hypothetical protein